MLLTSAVIPVLTLLVLKTAALHLKDMPLIWADEFDAPAGSQPDPSKWNYHIGDGTGQGLPGWGNSELEYYTDSVDNVAMDGNGNLVITATNQGASAYSCYYGACQFTSARLFTNCKFSHQYGRFEARLKTPTGQGCWPAFWMLGNNYDNLGWPDAGEIDIMELKGSNPNTVMGTLHGPGYSGSAGITDSYSLPNGVSFADDFHVFAIEWQPNSITWLVDDVAYRTRTPEDLNGNPWVFDHPFYFLFNFAVGGQFDGNPGPNTVFPQYYHIDYVRVYSDNADNVTTLAPPPTLPPTTTKTTTTQITTTTSPSGNRDAYSNIEAETANEQYGTSVEDCNDVGGGKAVTGIGNGDYLVFKNVDFGSTAPAGIQIRYSSGVTPGETGTFSVHVDSPSNQYMALLGIGYSGGWQVWVTEVGSISPPPTGIHDIYVTFQSNYADDFIDVNWFSFTH